jgi:RNA polymerase sigma-70 factor (ECF subfamily)
MNRNDAGAVSLEKYRPYLHLLARLELEPRLQGKVDLSGVVQQTLMEAHLDLGGLRNRAEAQVLAWLRRALANNLTDEIRKAGAQVRDVGRECSLQEALEESSCRLEGWLADPHSSPLQRIMHREQLAQLAATLEELPEDQRRAVELHHLKGRSLAEVATALGRSRGAVAQLIFRGLSRLRDLLEEPEEP